MSGKVATTVEQITAPAIADLGLELVDVNFVKEGGRFFLRIFIDGPSGIGLEECQLVSEKISPLLDEIDPITQAYYLEVSSPGLDRPLKKTADFERFMGSDVNLTTFKPIEGRRKFKGKLMAADDAAVTLEVEDQGQTVIIPMEQIASARLEPKF